MAQQIINNTETNPDVLQDGFTKVNENFTELYGDKHSHVNKSILDDITASYTIAEQTKLAGIDDNANNYVHPINHPPSIITQDENNRFVTDGQILNWDGKQNDLGYTPEDVANKVSSFQITPDDVAYPTEKLVYDNLELKVDKEIGKGLSENDLTDILKADYDQAVVDSHTHSNKTILDNTTASFLTTLKTEYDKITSLYAYYGVTDDLSNVFFDLNNRAVSNIKYELISGGTRSFILSNVPSGDCEIFLKLKYTTANSIIWWSNISWKDETAPVFTVGKTYRLSFWSEDSGFNWQGIFVGEW